MIDAGATELIRVPTAFGSVRSVHRTVTPRGNAAAALRLAGVSRSVATTWRPAAARCLTVALPTNPNAPVTSTASDIDLPPENRFQWTVPSGHLTTL